MRWNSCSYFIVKSVLYCEYKNAFHNSILYECGYNNNSSNLLSFSDENAGRIAKVLGRSSYSDVVEVLPRIA
jgi:hypothetical protein